MDTHREVERKFEAPPEFVPPDLTDLDGVSAVGEPRRAELEAIYFDTDDLRLAARGITLRRRTGGDDQGWHLKIPSGPSGRDEIRLPLTTTTDGVPAPLVREVRAVVRDRDLGPVAVVRTSRTERSLLGDGGAVLATVSDDTVRTEQPDRPDAADRWHEIEVELVDGGEGLLDAVSARFASAGVSQSGYGSKLHRALGTRAPAPPAGADGQPRSTAGEAVLAYLREQVDAVVYHDRGARRDSPDAVHRMRVATRRLRSAFATFGGLLDRERTEALRDELRWLGSTLGGPRDAEVLRARLQRLLATQPDTLVIGPVRERIDGVVGARHREVHDELIAALDGERYLRLLDGLEELLARPPLTKRANRPAERVLPRFVARACRRVALAAAAARLSAVPADRDTLLHDVRKAAKRARYVGESVTDVFGRRAAKLARRMEALQEVLGEHQDSLLARAALLDLGARAGDDGGNGFTFGVLHGLETGRGEAAERAYRSAIRAALTKGWHGERR